ncbi:HlyD family efflux transporter periplasmic adaptor subunit [Methylothermus subterraneus]
MRFFLVGLLALVLTGIAYLPFRPKEETAKELVLYGNIDLRQVDLAPGVAERIAKMYFWEGDIVHPGDLMAELVATRFAAEVENLKAQIAAQRALVEKLERGSRPQEIEHARALLAEAQSEETLAELNSQRARALLPKRLISQAEVDRAEASLKAARARRRAAQEAFSLALEGPRREDIAAARARLRALKAQLKQAKKNLADTKLYAPAAGVVQNRLLEPGDQASPQRPIYTLALTDPLWARVYLAETELGKVQPGMRAQVQSDSFPNKRYAAWVGYISPSAEFTPKNVETEELRTHLVYQARVFVCNPEGELRLGMPVTVRIPLSQPLPPPPSPCQAP